MSDPSDDANRWSWVTPDGKTVTGAKGELMLALRGGRLPPTTLVWRTGWAEWLPASRVTELKSVLPPGAAEPAQAPKLSASQPPPAPVRNKPGGPSQPPPAPMRNKGPATSRPPPAPVRAKPERQPLEIPGPRVPTAAGPVTAASGAVTRPRGVSILGPPREQMTNSAVSRAPLPTLGGEELVDPRMTTLRPPGAVPPPPRAVGPVLGAPKPEDDLPTQRKVPSIAGTAVAAASHGVEAPAPAASTEAAPTDPGAPPAGMLASSGNVAAAVPGSGAAGPLPSFGGFDAVQSSATLGGEQEVAPPSTTLESTAPSAPPGDPHAPLPNRLVPDDADNALPGDRAVTLPIPRSVAIVLALAVAGLLVLVTGGLMFSTRNRAASAAAPDASVTASASAEPAPGCRLLAPAARLSMTAERSVQPVLAEVVPGERVAVGFAPSPKAAGGAVVRLDTLDTSRMPDEPGDAAVRSSVPLVH
ncbi:MAG TPA: GYF domain-containing protein, partial [Polyangiaceae bacterium]|nr:GYF domain-containing protein [Polyangiaceae bacterium]